MPKRYHRRRKTGSKQGLVYIVGAGFMVLGLVAFFMLRDTASATEPQPVSRSVTPVEVNYPAPELSLQNVNGQIESLADYRDKIVLVNNWATWCPPCKAEIPTLEAYYQIHAVEGFVIIGIEAGGRQNDVLQFSQEHGITYPVWFDLESAAINAFHNGSLPSSYVIDRAGVVRLAWVGEINHEMLEKYVTPLLHED